MPVVREPGPVLVEAFQPVFIGVLAAGCRTQEGELEADVPVPLVQPDILQIGVVDVCVADPHVRQAERAVHRPGHRPGRVHGGESLHLAEIEQSVGAPAGVVPVELVAGEPVLPEVGRD